MAKKVKDSLVVFYEWEENLARLSDAQMGQVFRAIFAYEKRGERYEGEDFAVEMAMSFIYGVIDRNREKYEAVCERNRKNGVKGGAPVGNQNARKQPSGLSGLKKQPKQPDHEHDHERDHEHDHERDHEHDHERDHEQEKEASGILIFFRENFSGFSDSVQKEIEEACDQMGEEVVKRAMETAIQSGKKSWGYCKGILKNWKESGGGGSSKGEKLPDGLPDPLPDNWPRVPINPYSNAPSPTRPATLEEKAEMDKMTAENQRQLKKLLDSM